MIPYGRQDISAEDIDAVTEVLRSDWLTQGQAGPRFEQAMAAYCGSRSAIAVANATAALHIACLALDLGPGDLLWTTPNTFVASANCALYCGAGVDFVDIDPRTYNMSVAALAEKLEVAASRGRLPKIVVPVHFAGQSCEMREIRALADRYGFRHHRRRLARGRRRVSGAQGRLLRLRRYDDLQLSPGQDHHDWRGRHGPDQRIRSSPSASATCARTESSAPRSGRKNRRASTAKSGSTRNADGPWMYEQIELGLNYRMTDIQSALGTSQLARLDPFVARRRELAARYDRLLAKLPLTCPWQHPDTNSAWHLYVIRLHRNEIKLSRRQVFDALRAAGIGVNVHYIPGAYAALLPKARFPRPACSPRPKVTTKTRSHCRCFRE